MRPTRQECMNLLERSGVPDHIIRHSLLTARIARYLAEKLSEAGKDIDVELAENAALLHDISKYECIKNNSHIHHGARGGVVLRKMGLDEIAGIVGKHGLDSIFTGEIKTWEEKIVYYADKRVMNDEMVSLEDRFNYLEKKYPMAKEKFRKSMPLVKGLEKEIFDAIGEKPSLDGLRDQLRDKD